jgi:NADPH-dependent 2,4-dienoyl-CoA reductase/sulfur reductase-like enzyme/rhodanese-related sulfurtransferase
MDKIIAWVQERNPRRVAIVGGGFIGLEMLEQLRHKGLACILFESNPQVLMPLDSEMVTPIQAEIRRHEVTLELANPVNAISMNDSGALSLSTKRGVHFEVDLVIWSIGVRPETKLAADAGLTLGTTGGIVVNEHLQTSDPNIYAVGDCIEVTHGILKTPAFIPLAGPANRQGRIAADNICGIRSTYRGTIGTAIVRVFSLTAACTGANERLLERAGIPFKAIHLHPNSHAGYYPGAKPLALKVLFHPDTGELLGAQAVGEAGVDKRIDVIATAIQGGLSIEDIAELELCYAPPFGSAKDPVNMAGMVGENICRDIISTVSWRELEALAPQTTLLDVRDEAEVAKNGGIPRALNIPLNSLRSRLSELPKDKELIVYCHSGQRSYNACRILRQHGFRCRNLSGAFATWSASQGL